MPTVAQHRHVPDPGSPSNRLRAAHAGVGKYQRRAQIDLWHGRTPFAWYLDEQLQPGPAHRPRESFTQPSASAVSMAEQLVPVMRYPAARPGDRLVRRPALGWRQLGPV